MVSCFAVDNYLFVSGLELKMNPSDEPPESHVNGQTSQISQPPASATSRAKPRPKKGLRRVLLLLKII